MTDDPARHPSPTRRRAPDDAPAEPRARPDLALLARPVVDLRRAQLSSSPSRLEFTGLVDKAGRRPGAVPDLDQRRDHRDPRPADRRLDLRLHDLALGPAQAVHLHRLAARRRLPGRDRLVNTLLAIAAFIALLQFSSNFAQGPFQGYVPGPRAGASRSGLASALVGLMQVLGVVAGLRDRRRSRSPTHRYELGLDRARRPRAGDDAVGRHPGPRGPPAQVARGPAVALDRGRGVGHGHPARAQLPVAVASRLCVLMGGSRPDQPRVFYLARTMGLNERRRPGSCSSRWSALVALGDRHRGRARRRASRTGSAASGSSTASCAVGAVGLAIVAGAPSLPIAFVGALLSAISAGIVPGRRLGAHDRHHPEGLVGPVHGPSNVATGVGRGRSRSRSAGRDGHRRRPGLGRVRAARRARGRRSS